jgi:hypothetical protein
MKTMDRIAILTLLTAALVGARGCGGVQATRAEARERATKTTCDRYADCKLIGPGLTYENRDACEIAWRSTFDGMWPSADCEGRIDGKAFDVCLDRIGSTACEGFDFITTLGLCSKQNVCIGVATDGGTD